jgi:hypothetical protein
MDPAARAGQFSFLTRDRDGKFTAASDNVLAGNSAPINQDTGPLSPGEFPCGAVCGTLRRECPDHLLIYSKRHLRRIPAGYAQHYNGHRPHQSREQRPPLYEPGQPVDVTARIKRRPDVHGLINEYRRAA